MSRNQDWLRYAEELLEIADLLKKNEKYSWSCLTYQQTSSAALKAILSKHNESTYDDNLLALLRSVKKVEDVSTKIKEACQDINPYFKKSRDLERKKEGTPLDYITKKEADDARSDALTILRFAHHVSH